MRLIRDFGKLGIAEFCESCLKRASKEKGLRRSEALDT